MTTTIITRAAKASPLTSTEVDNNFINLKTTADAALPKIGGAVSGAITTTSTVDGRNLSVDGSKLDGIEAGATGDQTAAEIRAAIVAASDSNVFTDADHTKLNAIEASADVTDTANVTAAGALMDSELTSITSVKALNQGVATGDSPMFVGVTATSLDISGNVTMQHDDALLFIKETDGTNIAAVGDLTGAGQGGAFYYNHGGTATIQLKSYETSTIGHGLNVGGAVSATGDIEAKAGNELRVYRTDNAIYGSIEYLTGAGGLKLRDVNGDGMTFAGATYNYLTIASTTGNVNIPNSKLGIGFTTAPSAPLDIVTTGDVKLKFTRSANIIGVGMSNSASGGWGFYDFARSDYDIYAKNGSVGIGTSSPDEKVDITGGYLKFNGGDYGLKGSASLTYNATSDHYFQSNGSTKVTFKANGILLVGESADFNATSTTATGLAVTQDGRLTISRSGTPMYVSRLGSDGSLIDFWRQGVQVGSIGSNSGYLFVGGTAGSDAFLSFGESGVRPATSAGAARDAAIDLGGSSNRFKDLYLSAKVRWYSGSAQKAYMEYDGTNVVQYGASGVGHQFWAGGQRRVDITSGGDLLVGKAATSLATAGIALMSNDQVRVTTASDNPLELNRLSNDGDIARFYKDTVIKGAIGTDATQPDGSEYSGATLYIGAGDAGLGFTDSGDFIYPYDVDSNTPRDGTITLGHSSNRFKDAYFSGTMNTEAVSTNSLDLQAIAQSKSGTARDVFVYDTSKDSDGGAWRHRTQNTSWYNETLNTSTRGATKKFPSVAVIVAETTKVTIYDGDDPDMPMWMVLQLLNQDQVSISAMNGTVCFGNKFVANAGYGGNGLVMFEFAADRSRQSLSNGTVPAYDAERPGVISGNQADTSIWSKQSPNATRFYPIVNTSVNDVAVTVLPNAPIDADTGLPVPTIAVATDGGVSVIKDDGSVVDITHTSHPNILDINFRADGALVYATDSSSNARFIHVDYKIPSSDLAKGLGYVGTDSDEYYYSNTSTYAGKSLNLLVGTQQHLANNAVGSNNGLNIIAPNRTAPTQGLISYIASDYNTGWMNGDIKLATLSDTDTSTPASTNLVTNGTFDNTSNWSHISGATTAITGGAMVFTNGGGYGGFYQSLALVAGKSYTLSFDVTSYTTGSCAFSLADTSFGVAFTGTGSYSFVTAPIQGSDPYIRLYAPDSSVFTIDNVSVRVAESDRSVNGKGLQVFGTVTKTAVATGADLVAYSNFSSSNYLQQPVNTDFAGAYDYSFSCWSKTSSTSAYQYLFSVGNPASATGVAGVAIRPSDGVLYHYDNTNSSGYSTTNVANGVWNHIVVNIKNGVSREYYVNGVSVYSQSISAHTIASSPKYTVALYTGGTLTYHHQGSMALQRFSKTLPTAEQIAKMYRDEKHLFQENAKATLYGTSDAVTALAYDNDTELLHAGTSAGRSVFQGLRRVENTTDAVGSAISASNGLVAED